MSNYHQANKEATKKAEQAREAAREVVIEALRLARQCKGENVDPNVKAMASVVGKEAAEARKQAKHAAAEAAAARRIACKQAMGEKPVPPLPRETFNGGKMPRPIPRPSKKEYE